MAANDQTVPGPEAANLPDHTARRRRVLKGCGCGCGLLLLVGLVACAVVFAILRRVPASYPPPRNPVPPPAPAPAGTAGLDGFESPYLGHTGSWDGKGGAMFGATKIPDLDKEVNMGLRWTFMPVHWRALEPDGPVEPGREVPAAWRALDGFVIAAHRRGLNILMQAPVVGGNAGGPPAWAGRREKGKSAPREMKALADFAGKLARRYCPGGTLAMAQGWKDGYGVRAWELDNEPEMYRTHWGGQAGDYAEFVTLAAAQIKAADPQALIAAPAMSAGTKGLRWLEAALDPSRQTGSPAFQIARKQYSIGPVTDIVSFHNYEGLDSAFGGGPRTVGQVLTDIQDVFERSEQRVPGFFYERKQEYWHTEGNYDFIGVLSAERRAAWRIQFFTRAFAAGVRKVCVMDASETEAVAIRAYVRALPWPFPMDRADGLSQTTKGQAAVFRHLEPGPSGTNQVWVLWAMAGTGEAEVQLPVLSEQVTLVGVDGSTSRATAPGRLLSVHLKGDSKMAPPVMVVDAVP